MKWKLEFSKVKGRLFTVPFFSRKIIGNEHAHFTRTGGPPAGGRGTPDFKCRDDRRIFWGLKFSIRRFFGLGKFGKYFFGGLI